MLYTCIGILLRFSSITMSLSLNDSTECTKFSYFSGTSVEKSVINVLDLLQDEELQLFIVTFSENLDKILGGGVPMAKITEIYGEPGSGKTHLCLQLSVDVQIPQCLGGVGGECLFIDTEGSFNVNRLKNIAEATIEHCRKVSDENDAECQAALDYFSLDYVLSHLHYIRCVDITHLIAIVNSLSQILEGRTIKLVVIDSLAFPVRVGIKEISHRNRILSALAQDLTKIMVINKISVVVTNHLTTQLNANDDSHGHQVPALGENWSHVCSTRIFLERNSATHHRQATLVKSSSMPEDCVTFQILSEGIRDVKYSSISDIQLDSKDQRQPIKRSRFDENLE